MALWAVRCGSSGEYEPEALENGKLALDFNNTIDLTQVQTRNALKTLYNRIAPEATPNQINNWAGQLWSFKDSIKIGDLVVMPRKDNREFFAIGEIAGEYEYHTEQPSHKRAVKWISPAVRRDSLEQGLLRSLTSELTVFMPDRQKNAESEQRLRAVAGNWMFPPKLGDPWDEYVKRAKAYVATGRLESEEIEYKVEIGQALAVARQAVMTGAKEWSGLVRSGIVKNQNNLIHFTQLDNFRNWVDTSPDAALNALRALWTEDDVPASNRILAFSQEFPKSVTSGAGTRMTTTSVLLMGVDAEQYPPFRVTVFDAAYQRTGYDKPDRNADEAALYEHALGFLDQFIDEASKRGLTLRHRLDAQSVVWALKDGFGDIVAEEVQPDDSTKHKVDLQALAKDVYLPVEFLENIVTLLEDKKQVIFQGPPGTGKTYVAKELAKHLAGSEERVTLVQFHPSYAYEDFVQGFRPALLAGGQPGFELKDGPLLWAAKKAEADAKKDPDAKHYLVIDEINRGNIAKVFGELYFLLEYRNEKMRLQYQGEDEDDFTLPGNLYVIGTMNTADRSIALVDLALRRRFYFVGFHPDDEPVKSVLKKWLNAKGLEDMAWIADAVDEANRMLHEDRHAAIGPSYFMEDNLDEAAVERIWKHSVLPYIEERRFGGEQATDEFELDKLRGQVSQASAREGADGHLDAGGEELAEDGAK